MKNAHITCTNCMVITVTVTDHCWVYTAAIHYIQVEIIETACLFQMVGMCGTTGFKLPSTVETDYLW